MTLNIGYSDNVPQRRKGTYERQWLWTSDEIKSPELRNEMTIVLRVARKFPSRRGVRRFPVSRAGGAARTRPAERLATRRRTSPSPRRPAGLMPQHLTTHATLRQQTDQEVRATLSEALQEERRRPKKHAALKVSKPRSCQPAGEDAVAMPGTPPAHEPREPGIFSKRHSASSPSVPPRARRRSHRATATGAASDVRPAGLRRPSGSALRGVSSPPGAAGRHTGRTRSSTLALSRSSSTATPEEEEESGWTETDETWREEREEGIGKAEAPPPGCVGYLEAARVSLPVLGVCHSHDDLHVSRAEGPPLVLVRHAAGRHQDAAPAEQSAAARQPPERGLLRGPPLDGLGYCAGSAGGRAHVDGHVHSSLPERAGLHRGRSLTRRAGNMAAAPPAGLQAGAPRAPRVAVERGGAGVLQARADRVEAARERREAESFVWINSVGKKKNEGVLTEIPDGFCASGCVRSSPREQELNFRHNNFTLRSHCADISEKWRPRSYPLGGNVPFTHVGTAPLHVPFGRQILRWESIGLKGESEAVEVVVAVGDEQDVHEAPGAPDRRREPVPAEASDHGGAQIAAVAHLHVVVATAVFRLQTEQRKPADVTLA
ncbi:hypothetical protein EYF80_042878 [Liparis tanakae]|uniref:Uncharacterized protein n=1 Tax=Liparis tanakae TaxID=230148 RepID=A0A4Z2G1A1_9TELE|nr:hypothetical protein EYF80_042878 [Liparis tanakae]